MRRSTLTVTLVFAAGIAVGALAAKKGVLGPELYSGKPPAEAAAALLDAAHGLAGKGSFENIAVGRVLYLTGKKQEGQAIFDRVLGAKHETGDTIRVARVYREAGEWPKAKELFDKVIAEQPKDEDWLAEIGAYYLLAGDRAHGEELLARSFAEDPSNLDNSLKAASGYLGLKDMP